MEKQQISQEPVNSLETEELLTPQPSIDVSESLPVLFYGDGSRENRPSPFKFGFVYGIN